MLFVVFAMAVLLVLLSGGRIYQNVVQDIGMQYESRTSISYITTKLHRCDSAGSVSVESFGDSEALVLSEIGKDGRQYETVIYLYDGDIREFFSEKGNRFPPSTGKTILTVESLHFTLKNNNLVIIEYSTGEGSYSSYVYLRSNGGSIQ